MINNSPRSWQKTFALITFGWFLLAIFAAMVAWRFKAPEFLAPYFPPTFHPRFVTVTLAPLLGFQYYWVRRMVGNDPAIRELSSRRYLIMFLLIAGFLTGISTSMGFLPFFFHQIAVWPLSLYAAWDFYQSLRGK